MSYDLIFLRRQPGQSWTDTIDAAEQTVLEGGEPSPLSPDMMRQIFERLRAIGPDVTRTEDGFQDEELSIDISCWVDEAAIAAPYWYTGEAARRVMERMLAYAAVVEEVTGLQGFDPQLELDLSQAAQHLDDVVEAFDAVAESFQRS